MQSCESGVDLSIPFRDKNVPVTHSSMNREVALMALRSEPFRRWLQRCEKVHGQKRIELHAIEIQSVDLFGARKVGFVKIKSECTLVDGDTKHEHRLPGICFLRGDGVTILVALCCEDDGKVYSLLVEQPRIPIGQVATLELPAGMIDDANDGIAGTASKEMEEECGIKIRPSELIDLTELALQETVNAGHLAYAGIPPSPGGCDEYIRYMYTERKVSIGELDKMRGRLSGLRDHGEYITLRVVPMEEMWNISGDAKVMCALFLADQLRKQGKLPPVGDLAGMQLPSSVAGEEPTFIHTAKEIIKIPRLAFGLYKVPPTLEGEKIISEAIAAGYRHFDSASLYENERILGQAIRKSGIPRDEFFLCSKVWNDAQNGGRAAVRKSVEHSLAELDSEGQGYFDLFYVHWPVPGRFIETYKELEELQKEGKIRSIGLSNFGIAEYEELIKPENDITVLPIINQIEVSPFMYRPTTIAYFQNHSIYVAASKALHRALGLQTGVVKEIADAHSVTAAQVLLRWSLQKRLIVVTKTSSSQRMEENRAIMNFSLTETEMMQLDSLTTKEDIHKREELEAQRRKGL